MVNGVLWSSAQMETLKALWAEGVPSKGIAENINDRYGMKLTYVAVNAKAERMRLPKRPRIAARPPEARQGAGIIKARVQRRIQDYQLLPKIPRKSKQPEDFSRAVTLADRRHNQCKWVIGENATGVALYCGHERGGNKNYCPIHAARERRK